MRVRLSAPSKTFLLGEYAVLAGGRALIANTAPRFEMKIETPGSAVGGASVGGIHPRSPAGLWIRSHLEDFKAVRLSFEDPHRSLGGFGASSAQFLFVNLWSRVQKTNLEAVLRELRPEDIWQDFRDIGEASAPEADRVKPSGGDLIAQWQGYLTVFRSSPFLVQQMEFPFKNLDFALLRTGHKIPTHKHLEQVSAQALHDLRASSEEIFAALELKNEELFLSKLRSFTLELEYAGLTALNTQDLLAKLNANSKILAAKGCGAMGADVIAIFYQKQDQLALQSFVKQTGLQWIASQKDLSSGLQVAMDEESAREGVVF